MDRAARFSGADSVVLVQIFQKFIKAILIEIATIIMSDMLYDFLTFMTLSVKNRCFAEFLNDIDSFLILLYAYLMLYNLLHFSGSKKQSKVVLLLLYLIVDLT